MDDPIIPADAVEAERMLQGLSKFFDQPVMPLSGFCEAMTTWFQKMQARQNEIARGDGSEGSREDAGHYANALGRALIDIRKSNLLYRLIYLGQKLRNRPCPIHKGRWSGYTVEGCDLGCGETGWLPDDPKDLQGGTSPLFWVMTATPAPVPVTTADVITEQPEEPEVLESGERCDGCGEPIDKKKAFQDGAWFFCDGCKNHWYCEACGHQGEEAEFIHTEKRRKMHRCPNPICHSEDVFIVSSRPLAEEENARQPKHQHADYLFDDD